MDPDKSIDFILFSHELPSGEVQDMIRRLHRFSKLPGYPNLACFLQNCALVLKAEVRKLPRPLRDSVPPFHDVMTLVSYWDDFKTSPLHGVWNASFLCIYEMAVLIGHFETHRLSYRGAGCLVGVSFGLFAAAAAAVSESISDLVFYSAESLRIAFTFSIHVHRVSQNLESTVTEQAASTQISWATAIRGVPLDSVRRELEFFNCPDKSNSNHSDTTPLTGVSISHVDNNSVGVTGPPSRIKQLFRESELLRSSNHSALPIPGGLCHAQNVYDDYDVRTILETAEVYERWRTRAVQVPLISPFTGSPFPCSDAFHLIEAICTEALTKPLYFDSLADGLATQLSIRQQSQGLSGQILHYRTTLISDTIITDVANKLSTAFVRRQCLLDWAERDDAFNQSNYGPSPPENSKLAIVGMSCRMPGGADTPDRFWDLLVRGSDTCTEVPPDRFDLDTHFDATGEKENSVSTRFGSFIENPGYFDAGFFNMSPREAEQTDPMQRLALVTAYEALEMSGFVPNRTPSSRLSRVGTYYGQTSDDYREVNAGQRIGTYGTPGTVRAFGNGRINYFFNFQGPSINIDTACSSGLAAVQAACSALWAGEADTVVAGGLNVITNPDIYCMLGKGHFLSKTGQCKVWDSEADGYCRGDGVGSVVIKRLDDALADNDVILASIVAGATNHSAESLSITQPHAATQKQNYRQVMNKAGISPLDVGYVELHGTGTQVGDAVESESVLDFFAPKGQRLSQEKRLHLGAVKSNIGHGEAAAGIASLIKVLLMYRNNMIPRHIGIRTTINPVVVQHLAHRNAGLVFENHPWLPSSSSEKRYSVVNSFGAHGGNTTLLLEDSPPQHIGREDGCSQQSVDCNEVVCISAKSKASLKANIGALLDHLNTHKDTKLRDIAYTTSARRIHHHIRVATSISTTAQLQSFLQAAANDIDSHASHVRTASEKKVIFAFSGQGCMYHGAAEQLFQTAPQFRDLVVQLDRIVRRLGFPSILAAVAGDAAIINFAKFSQNSSSDMETIDDVIALSDSGTYTPSSTESANNPLIAQLALVATQIALVQYWELLGIKPSAVIGHSLGEYAALVSADVLSVTDALFLVGKRAELMMAHCEPESHAMLSVRGASVEQIQEICRKSRIQDPFEVSCLNGLANIVVSGLREEIMALLHLLLGSGLKCTFLDLPFAFHSKQMSPLLDDFENVAHHVTFKAPERPVISPLLGQCVSEDEIIDAKYLARATREPVNFVAALDAALADGLVSGEAVWIDIGPHPVCTSFASQHYGKASTKTFASLRHFDETLSTFTGSLAVLHCLGYPIAWNEFYDLRENPARLLHLDTYRWNNRNYWIQYKGSWTLDKAHASGDGKHNMPVATSTIFTSSVQQIISENFDGCIGKMEALSDLNHSDLREAAGGHKMNGRSIMTASIWTDIAFTVGEYLYKRTTPDGETPLMDVTNMEVVQAQMLDPELSSTSTTAKFVRIEGLLDLSKKQTNIQIYSAAPDGTHTSSRPFATVTVCYEEAHARQEEWQMISNLVAARATALWYMTTSGAKSLERSRVSNISQNVAYQLFANVVDYSARYRGMQRVAFAGDSLEASAEIVLDNDRHGTWHTPPHWIDSCFQLAGFVMNSFGVKPDGKFAGSSRNFFFLTPGWRHFRLLEPLEAGPDVTYRNYARMFPVSGEPGTYTGDMYLYRDDRLVGMCVGVKFKAVPRALMPALFPPFESGKKPSQPAEVHSAEAQNGGEQHQSRSHAFNDTEMSVKFITAPSTEETKPKYQDDYGLLQIAQAVPPISTVEQKPEPVNRGQVQHQNPIAAVCLSLIADETGLDLDDLTGDAFFTDLGVDSLMSLALSAKIRAQLGIDVQASIFLECPTVHDLISWLSK